MWIDVGLMMNMAGEAPFIVQYFNFEQSIGAFCDRRLHTDAL